MARFKWRAETDYSGNGNGLFWTPARRNSAYDVYAMHEALDIPPPASQASLIFDQDDAEGVIRERARTRKKRISLVAALTEYNDHLITIADGPTIIFIARDDNEEIRRNHWARRKKFLARHLGEAPEVPLAVPAQVWGVRVYDLLDEIQYHLLQPTHDGGLTWQPQYSHAQVADFLRERVSEFLNRTGLVKTRKTLALTAGTADYALDSTLTALQRVYLSGPLARENRWSLDRSRPSWELLNGAPDSFVEEPDKRIVFVPNPSSPGTASYVFISSTATEGSQSFIFQTLTIPATFAWGIKYGVMADMLSAEGEGNDPTRAAYCETRFNDSVALARLLMGATLKEQQSGS